MTDRDRALAEIARLAREHGLTSSDVTAAIDGGPGQAGPAAPAGVVLAQPRPADTTATGGRRQELLVRVLGILGATFVFAGIGTFIALQWEAMNSAARVVVTLGSGVAAFALALLAARDPRARVVAVPLFLVAAALEPTGMFVAFDEYGSGGDWQLAALITFGAVGLQFGAAFGALRRSTLLFLTIFFAVAFAWSGLDYANMDGTIVALTLGVSMMLAAVGADRSGHGDVTPFWYFCGATAFLGGLFDVVDGTPVEAGFLLVAIGFVYLAVALRSRTLLVVSTMAILGHVGWFTSQHFAESVGWPLALIAFGLFMIGLSAVAYRIDRDYVRRRA